MSKTTNTNSTANPINDTINEKTGSFAGGGGGADKPLTFDLHPLYAAILQDGAAIREGEVLGLDGDLRRVLVAPFDGVIRLLVTGTGPERRVKVFLTARAARRENYAPGRR